MKYILCADNTTIYTNLPAWVSPKYVAKTEDNSYINCEVDNDFFEIYGNSIDEADQQNRWEQVEDFDEVYRFLLWVFDKNYKRDNKRIWEAIDSCGLDDDQKEALHEELKSDGFKHLWYAVLRDREDNDYGYGSFDLDEAERMCRDMESDEAYIAVVDADDGDFCLDEIRQEDF